MSNESFGQWVSSGLRFALGLGLIALAYIYDNEIILYVFGGAVFLTGFLRPKRCVDGCELNQHSPKKGQPT